MRLISFATAALVLFMMAGCQQVENTQPPVEASPVGGVAVIGAGDPTAVNQAPPRNARNVFIAYASGIPGVEVLVDRDTGCEWLATRVSNTGGSSVAAGYTSIQPRTLNNTGSQKCRAN